MKLLTYLIRIYQTVISPLIYPSCRFFPSCSHYSLQAFRTHGFWQGFILSTLRICRCHPGHPGGFDPIPGKIKNDSSF